MEPLTNKFSLPLLSLEAGCGVWVVDAEVVSGLFRGVAVGASTGRGLIGDKAGPGSGVVEGGAVDLEFADAWEPRWVGVEAEEAVKVRGVGVEGLLGVEDRELGLVGSLALN